MLNRNERMNQLNNAGVDTSKYFNVNLPNGLKPGSTISLVINENGEPVIVTDNGNENIVVSNDTICNQIIADGYVRNTKLHRRFVMAQMFQMLNYVSYCRQYRGYNDCLKKRYGYDYTLTMMLDEVKVLSKLEDRDAESFTERVHFFDKNVVAAVMQDYLDKLIKQIDAMPNKNCKGIPYKTIKGTHIFVADLDKKIYAPIRSYIFKMKYARTYTDVYKILNGFMSKRIKLKYDTPKSKVWIDAFKGAGAYYTLKNLVMFHDCTITSVEGIDYGVNSMAYLKEVLRSYKGEYYRMFALMNKVIADNGINTATYIRELSNN